MADLRLRDKLREIEKAAKTEDQVSERAKSWGVTLFTIMGVFVVIALFLLSLFSFLGGSIGMAITFGILGLLLSWIGWNLWRAPKLP